MKYKVIIRQKAEKQLNKQNFVKGKITKYECISFAIIFIMTELIYAKITFICESERSFTKRVLFFLYKKVLRKAGQFVERFASISKQQSVKDVKITVIAKKGMASDTLTLKKHINKIKKKHLLIIISINKLQKSLRWILKNQI